MECRRRGERFNTLGAYALYRFNYGGWLHVRRCGTRRSKVFLEAFNPDRIFLLSVFFVLEPGRRTCVFRRGDKLPRGF